jgi:hypothetical protein
MPLNETNAERQQYDAIEDLIYFVSGIQIKQQVSRKSN